MVELVADWQTQMLNTQRLKANNDEADVEVHV